MIRFDFIFSYWIFIWYLLYSIGIIKYSPKFAILCGIIENFGILFLMIFYGTKLKLILLFTIMFVILKVIPFYTIYKTPIHINDVIVTILLILLYLAWMTYNHKTLAEFKSGTYDMILHNKITLPGMKFIHNLYNELVQV